MLALSWSGVTTTTLASRHFSSGDGAEAQAAYGLGTRVMQAIFLPAMAIAFATAPLAGQNVGAGKVDRVRQTFRSAAGMGSAIMLVLTRMNPAMRLKSRCGMTPFKKGVVWASHGMRTAGRFFKMARTVRSATRSGVSSRVNSGALAPSKSPVEM